MRICVAYDCLFPHTVGGAERWYANLAERLAKEGHEVTYVTLRQWDRGEQVRISPDVRVVAAGPRMQLYTAGGRRRILPPLVFGLGMLLHLARSGRRYDVVHTCAFPYFSLLAAGLLRPVQRYELVVDWFEVWSSAYWREYLGRAGGRIGELIQRMCARVPQHAYCFSRLQAERLRAIGVRGTITMLRGLYSGTTRPPAPSSAEQQIPPAEPLILFAARLIPEKQVTLAVAAVALAAGKIDGLRGVFFGDGPERGALDAAVAEHSLQCVISVEGFVDAATVDATMARAMCVLSTSRREGYGMVVVEAAAHGTPSVVVAGEDNAATELIEEGVNGFVATRPDPATIAEAILRVHAAGVAMRASTASWFAENAEELSLASSLATVLAGYAGMSASLAADS